MTWSLVLATLGLTGCKSLQDYMEEMNGSDKKNVEQAQPAAAPAAEKKMPEARSSAYGRSQKVAYMEEPATEEDAAVKPEDAKKPMPAPASAKHLKNNSLKKVEDMPSKEADPKKAKEAPADAAKVGYYDSEQDENKAPVKPEDKKDEAVASPSSSKNLQKKSLKKIEDTPAKEEDQKKPIGPDGVKPEGVKNKSGKFIKVDCEEEKSSDEHAKKKAADDAEKKEVLEDVESAS